MLIKANLKVAQTWSRGLGSRSAVLLFVLAVRAGVAPRQAGRLVVAVVIWDHEDNINIKYDDVAGDLGAGKNIAKGTTDPGVDCFDQ